MSRRLNLLEGYTGYPLNNMKRIVIIILTMWCAVSAAEAQTWNEWFRQKKTQKKYLVQQIAALKVYLKYLKEGYDISKKGLKIVGDIKDGNFSDHSTYFQSLKLVKPSVKMTPKVSLIISYQAKILEEFRKLNDECRSNNNLSNEEVQYVSSVYKNLLERCEDSIAELNSVITDNASQMKDEERIGRIENVYDDMKDRYSFTRSFCNSTRMLMMERDREQSEVDASKKLNTSL
jgi:hypothetical protein